VEWHETVSYGWDCGRLAGYGWWVRQNFSIRVVGERPLSAGLSRVSELLQEVCPDFWQEETISGKGRKGGTLPYR
jgi:hypothetical protein